MTDTPERELIERLRSYYTLHHGKPMFDSHTRFRAVDIHTAADTIEALLSMVDKLEEAVKSAESWLYGWAVHVGNCAGGSQCTCGLTAVRHECALAVDVLNRSAS